MGFPNFCLKALFCFVLISLLWSRGSLFCLSQERVHRCRGTMTRQHKYPKTGGLFSRILFILKPSIGKETSQLVREEPMIDNDSHEEVTA